MGKASPWGSVTVAPPASHRARAGVTYAPRKFKCQSCTAVWNWGAQPGSATLVYVTNDTPVGVGAKMQIDLAGHTFWGMCQSDESVFSTRGKTRTIQFADNRVYLDFDVVKGSFNMPNDRIVGGRRVRRFAHILPRNFRTLTRTFSDYPYSAREIITHLLSAPTTEDRWICTYHNDQLDSLPVQFDWLSGVKLGSALQQLGDAQGLTFTLLGGPYSLVWARKGEGILPSFAANSDDRTSGVTLTDNPTRIEILGDRNVYQVHDAPMIQDWARAWEKFYDPLLFVNHIYEVGTLTSPLTIGSQSFAAGTPFRTVGAHKVGAVYTDPEQIISRQLAIARANEIAVREYAALVNDNTFLDYRKYAGRSRLEMPAMLYINQILFRAFRFADGFYITNADGRRVYLPDLTPSGKMIGKVTHDPTTGIMACDTTQSPDGNGYAIVRGYQVGKDLFQTIRPERFNLSQWTDSQNIWEHIEFQVDDSGEGDGCYILFDAPVIRSSELISMVNGYAVVKAHKDNGSDLVFNVPEVRVAMAFEAERLSFTLGQGPRDDLQTYPGLSAEFVISQATDYAAQEVAYLDGEFAMEKARDLAESLLCRQLVLARGKFTKPLNPNPAGRFDAGTQLTAMMDRVEVEYSTSGCKETVFLTNEYPRQTYVPERDLDRGEQLKAMIPGQAELRHLANQSKLFAAALASSPDARKLAQDAYRSIFGTGEIPVQVFVRAPSSGVAEVAPAGSAVVKEANTLTDGQMGKTECLRQSDATPGQRYEFVGVTFRGNEQVGIYGSTIPVHNGSEIKALTQGPVEVDDVVGLAPGGNHLAKDADVSVGKAMQGITDATVKLIRVRTTSAVSESSFPFQIKRTASDQAKVSTGYLLKSFDATDAATIYGLETDFNVYPTSLIYLEILFDKNLAPFLLSICCRSAWDTEVYPHLVRAARNTDDNRLLESTESWVLEDAGASRFLLATEKWDAFDTKWRCWKTFHLIGYATTDATAKGVKFSDVNGDYTVVQCTDTNLLLSQFCDAGIPALLPIPYFQPKLN